MKRNVAAGAIVQFVRESAGATLLLA